MEEIWSNVYAAGVTCQLPAKPKVKALEDFVEKHDKRVLNDTIKKLHELINDPLTQAHMPWINRLFDEFFRENECRGFKVRDLPFIAQVMEFLVWKMREIPEYEIHMNKMLRMCRHSPYLEKSSDMITASAILEQYYTNLGYLVVLLPTSEQVLILLESLHELLSQSKFTDARRVKLEHLHRAIEKTSLPLIMVKLYDVCSRGMQEPILQIIYALSMTSHIYSHKMLEHGIMNSLLLQLEKSYENVREEGIEEEIILIIKILWLLVDSISTCPSNFMHSKHVFAPSHEAMRSLTNVFKSTLDGVSFKGNIVMHRNYLAMIILAGLMVSPPWNIINCGLAADVIILSKSLKIPINHDDLVFTRTLLAILCHLSDSRFCISMMKQEGILDTILQLVSTNDESKNSNHLIPYVLRTLSRLVPKMTEEFINLQGSSKLQILLEWVMTMDLNSPIIYESIRSISLIISAKNSALLTNLQSEGIFLNLFSKFINRILMLNQLTTDNQKILMLSLMTIETLSQNNTSLASNNGSDKSVRMLLKFLQRCLNENEEDFIIDERLTISTAYYLWKCIISCSMALEEFIDLGGMYLILDNLSHCPISVRSLFLGILSDLCVDSRCILHLCTWRGADKSRGFFSLLAKLWREEEEKLEVKRTENGCIDDIELPLMGKEQWSSSFYKKNTENYSPTLESWLGSVRPKIYSIRKQLMAKSETLEKAKERYKILTDLPHQDAITFCIIDQFFRFTRGQMWGEVLRYLKQKGINPLGTDGEMLLIMCQRHRECGLYVRRSQETILREHKRIEMQKEVDDISKIRDARLTAALQAVKTIDLIRKTADKSYRSQKKNQQKAQVDRSLKFPVDANSEHCHRTYPDKLNVTTIFSQTYKTNNSHADLACQQLSSSSSRITVSHDFFQDINY